MMDDASSSDAGMCDRLKMVAMTRPHDAPTALHIVLGDYECSMTVRAPGDAAQPACAESGTAYVDGISFDGAGHMRKPLDGMPADDFHRLEAIMLEHADPESGGSLEPESKARCEAHVILARHFTAVADRIEECWLEDFATFHLVPQEAAGKTDDAAADGAAKEK